MPGRGFDEESLEWERPPLIVNKRHVLTSHLPNSAESSLSVGAARKSSTLPSFPFIAMHTYAKPVTPFVFPFHEELTYNCKIDVHGEVWSPEMRFFVDILSGPHSLLNVEFCFGDERMISLRSCSSDIDSNETIEVTNPLHAGMKFHLNIVVRLNYYHVRLNGYTVALFAHRYPPHLAQCLAVSKYVKIYSVNVEGFQSTKEWTAEHDGTTSGYFSAVERPILPSEVFHTQRNAPNGEVNFLGNGS